jgi:hypothetical protein
LLFFIISVHLKAEDEEDVAGLDLIIFRPFYSDYIIFFLGINWHHYYSSKWGIQGGADFLLPLPWVIIVNFNSFYNFLDIERRKWSPYLLGGIGILCIPETSA